MRRIILAGVLMLSAAWAHAQEVLAPNPAIEGTIQGQFDAFRADDLEGAWQYASPNIQRLFQSPQNFGRMVQQGYPMVWRPGRVEFLDLQSFGGIIVQRVEVIDAQGTRHILGYQMVQTGAGWQINGVQILEAPEIGV